MAGAPGLKGVLASGGDILKKQKSPPDKLPDKLPDMLPDKLPDKLPEPLAWESWLDMDNGAGL